MPEITLILVDLHLFNEVVATLRQELEGKRFGRVFQTARFEFAIDMHLGRGRFLFVSIEPSRPRVYLITRKLKDIERSALPPSPFVLQLKKQLSNAIVKGLVQIPNERVFAMNLDRTGETGMLETRNLAVQLTGRSSNLFLLDDEDRIIASAKEATGPGQELFDTYSPPPRPAGTASGYASAPADNWSSEATEDLFEKLDQQYQKEDAERRARSLANSALAKVRGNLERAKRLQKKLSGDLTRHGDADEWKRKGDLLMANAACARRCDDHFVVIDYFNDALPELEIEAKPNESVTEAAERYFRRYTKARNAKLEIKGRLAAVEKEISDLEAKTRETEEAIEKGDLDRLERLAGAGPSKNANRRNRAKKEPTSGTRSFTSSDGLEILVGKKAKDNDHLTFRIARSLDTWMHAADYPGSHVVIRNPERREIPSRTLLEAARIAAFYSKGNKQPKAAVHYTQKKFVNKPRGAAPGLVSLSSFKTLLVEPGIPDGLSSEK